MTNNFFIFISAIVDSWILTGIANIVIQIISTLTGILAGVVGIMSLFSIVKIIIIDIKIAIANKEGKPTYEEKERLKKWIIRLVVMIVSVSILGLISGLLPKELISSAATTSISPKYSSVANIEQIPDT